MAKFPFINGIADVGIETQDGDADDRPMEFEEQDKGAETYAQQYPNVVVQDASALSVEQQYSRSFGQNEVAALDYRQIKGVDPATSGSRGPQSNRSGDE